MSKKISKLVALSIFLVILSLSIVSCKSNITFTYDELNRDLIRIELAHRTFSHESEYVEHCEVYKTLSNEETEYVLAELSKITFTTFNNYGPGIQHLYRHEDKDIWSVPEFLCVNVSDMQPDINIILA